MVGKTLPRVPPWARILRVSQSAFPFRYLVLFDQSGPDLLYKACGTATRQRKECRNSSRKLARSSRVPCGAKSLPSKFDLHFIRLPSESFLLDQPSMYVDSATCLTLYRLLVEARERIHKVTDLISSRLFPAISMIVQVQSTTTPTIPRQANRSPSPSRTSPLPSLPNLPPLNLSWRLSPEYTTLTYVNLCM